MQSAGPKKGSNSEQESAVSTDPTELVTHLTKALQTSEAKLRAIGAIAKRSAAAEQALRRDTQQYRQMIDTAQEGVWLRDADARTTFVNRRICSMLGYTVDEMMGRPVYDFIDAESRAEAEQRFAQRKKGVCQQHDVRYKHKDGSDVWTIVSASPIYDDDGVFIGALGMITDITERKRHEETIWRLAYYDTLTGLANRSLLEDRLHQLLIPRDSAPEGGNAASRVRSGSRTPDASGVLAPTPPKDSSVAVMFIDLDRFKQVNDTLGHDFGDHLLKVIAKRLTACLRPEDTIARMGGDEFTALLPGVEYGETLADVARRLLESLAQPIEVDAHEVSVSASIGVSLHPADGHDAQTLLKHADVAMYRAKEQGGNAWCLFTRSMNANALDRLTLESSLRKALSREEFFLVYQPQVDLDTGEILAVEALCRWSDPELGVVPPARFISLAEETGMIVPLGEWVLREACRQAAAWRAEGHPIRVSVNVSTRQLSRHGLAELVRSVLTDTGLDAEWLELELTESAIMKSTESAVDALLSVRDLGVRLALDDFGTGYSSLSYLQQFQFEVLKIDRSFVGDIVGNKVKQAIVRAIIELSRALELDVVAEGVETDDQRRVLQALGCRVAQGYLFSAPVLPSQIQLPQTLLRAA